MRPTPANDTQNALAALNDIDRPDFNIEEAADRIEGARQTRLRSGSSCCICLTRSNAGERD